MHQMPLVAALLVATTPPGPGADHGSPQRLADLVLVNGRIVTLEESIGTAEGLAVAGDRILEVGRRADIERLIGPSTHVRDVQGAVVIPGFIDGHGHLAALGQARMMLDLTAVRDWSEVVAMVEAAAARSVPGEWIRGRGWHQEKWARGPAEHVEGFPTHHSLSAVSPHNPVLLTHASGHACFANQRAMELAGISAATSDPPGGEVLRDAAGRPIGVFRETAQDLIATAMEASQGNPARDDSEAIRLAVRECLARGVTSFQDAGSSFATIDTLRRMAESGALEMRVWVMVREPNEVLRQRLGEYATLRGAGRHHLTVGGIKCFLDGALGSRGAWLLEPYSDSPQSTGLATGAIDEIAVTAELALQHDLQLCVHAIGDRANREVLDLYQGVQRDHPERRDLRWRIEHAQHISPQDIPRFAQQGVIASMQPIHCTSDAPWVIARLGEARARQGAYVWRSLLDSGAIVSSGTDAPVESVDPIPCFHAAVTRRLPDGSRFFPEQRMSRLEALRSYTIDAAYAAREEALKGTLLPGKLADLVVLSRDILTVPEEQIPGTTVQCTIVGGQVVFEAPAADAGP